MKPISRNFIFYLFFSSWNYFDQIAPIYPTYVLYIWIVIIFKHCTLNRLILEEQKIIRITVNNGFLGGASESRLLSRSIYGFKLDFL